MEMTLSQLIHTLIDCMDDYGADVPVYFNDKYPIRSITSKMEYSITAAEYPRIILSDKDEDE